MKWSESLTKTTIDEWLFDVELSPEEAALFADVRAICREPIDTAERVKQAKAALKALPPAKQLSANARELVSSLKEDLAEIAADLKFAKSRRGKYVLFVQNYVQHIYKTLRPDPRFSDVIIGGHTEKEVVLVAGKAKSEADLEAIKAILDSSPSGLPVDYRVLIKP